MSGQNELNSALPKELSKMALPCPHCTMHCVPRGKINVPKSHIIHVHHLSIQDG